MIGNQYLRKFLALDRISAVYAALSRQASRAAVPATGNVALLTAFLLACMPLFAHFLSPKDPRLDLVSVLLGSSACLALVLRNRLGIRFTSVSNWRQALGHTHVAFGLGCIPAVVIFLLQPQAAQQIGSGISASQSSAPSTPEVVLFILAVACWSSLTEELIFRGLLISVLRRWQGLHQQWQRDCAALTLSSLLFGLAHLPAWGPLLSLALVGIGFGLGVAYLAIGERVLPVVIYHLVFNALSLSFAIFFI
jgi:membrane protease YdiL (CAAX protease family)